MSVAIEEITAEVQPPPTPAAPVASNIGGEPPEAQQRKQGDLLIRLERRATRLRAD